MPTKKTEPTMSPALWIRLRVALRDAEQLFGFESDSGHRKREYDDYCPFKCRICDDQRYIEKSKRWLLSFKAPVQ